MKFIKTYVIVVLGHGLICDVGSLLIGRWTTVTLWIAIPIVIAAGLVVTCVLEKPWHKGECDAGSNDKGVHK